MVFNMMQHHKYSLSEIEEMIPWERDVYVQLLITHLKEEEQRAKAHGNVGRSY